MNHLGAHLPLPIDHAFFDSPIGKEHGKQPARSLPPHDRRTPVERAGDRLYKLVNRVFNALAPKGRRTDVEYRDGLKHTSREVGALLGAVIHGRLPAGPRALVEAFECIKDTAEPVTRRGVKLSDLLAQRFDVHLSRLTDKELKTLRTQLTVLRATTKDPDASSQLDLLHSRLCRETERRVFTAGQAELLPCLTQAIQETQHNPALAADTFAGLGGITKSIMARCGLSLEAKYKDETLLAQAVIRKVINNLLMSGEVSAGDLKTLLAALTSESLAELQPSENEHLSVQDTDALELLVEDVAVHRRQATLGRFNKAVAASNDTLPKEAAPVSADTLRHLIDVSTQWNALQKHAKAFDVPVHPDTAGELDALRERLSQLTIDVSSLKPLKDHELSALAKALEVLPLPDGKAHIAQAMTMRLERSTQKVGEALPDVIGALAQDATGQALQALAEFEPVVSKAKARSDALQGLTQTGGDDVRRFEFDTYGPVFNAMDATQLKTCLHALSSTFSLQLIETLKAMGSELCTAGGGAEEDLRSVTGSRLLAMGQVLLGLLGEAGAESARRANPDNPPAYEVPDIDTTRQDPAIRDAVRQLFPVPQ
jgi:hypothetical protein